MDQKVTLVICDGLGLSSEAHGNAVLAARTPNLDYALANYPAIRLLASGTEVGLDMGEPGNSEVGHLTIGTGQVIPQAFQLINSALKSGAYKQNKALLLALHRAKQTPGATLHIMGLVSAGGVHGHRDHLLMVLSMAKELGIERVVVHAITDGRDSPPQVAQQDVAQIQAALKEFSTGVIASISGRFYAMDRDKNWERTDAAYWAFMGKAMYTAATAEQAIQQAYQRGETDESLTPTIITTESPIVPQAGDVVIVTNFRPDRARQITTRLLMAAVRLTVVTLTNYFLEGLPVASPEGTELLAAFDLPKPEDTLAQTLARRRKRQLHIAETEKYAHVTYFFNGHDEQKHEGESWLLVPSPKVASFAQAPAMSAGAVTAAYLNAQAHTSPDFCTVNYANCDMVGHTGDFAATQQAVEIVDVELGRLIQYAEAKQEWLLITADHGNAEQMIHPLTGEMDKEHTTNPVPFIAIHPSLKQARGMTKQQIASFSKAGILADVASTILAIYDIPKPRRMAGENLLEAI